MTSTLLADIGGTNATFALLTDGRIGPAHADSLDRHPDPAAALAAWLEILRPAAPTGAVLAVAGPVRDQRARLTNRDWWFEPTLLARGAGLDRVTLVNDFLALALALPRLQAEDLLPLGGGAAESSAPCVVLGPGTGLGVAALLPPDRPLATEGGHATLPAHTAREAAVIATLRARFGHVSAERCLSGPGLENLFAALAALDRENPAALNAATIVDRAIGDDCPRCAEALSMFCAMLGGVAADQALSHGATGGVFLAGGILPRLTGFLQGSGFRARFEAKGRFREWLAPIPTALIIRPHAALLGLAAVAGTGATTGAISRG